MKSLRIFAATVVAACLITAVAVAAAADPSGSWKWSQAGRQGGTPREITAKLTLKDGKLTGSVTQPGRGGGDPVSADISDGSFKDGTVAFSLVREFNGTKITTKYEGKLDGDSIKGSSEVSGFGGDPIKTDWAATRAKM